MTYSNSFTDALTFAANLHAAQTRKGSGVPYIHHLLATASIVGEHDGSETQVIAALLHDSIEDQLARVPDLRQQLLTRFGPDVLAIVEACTDAETLPKPPWRERKVAYIKHLEEAPDAAPFLLVSAADKLHNASSILRDHSLVQDAIWSRFKAGREGTQWYYQQLARTLLQKDLGSTLANSLSSQLHTIVTQLLALP